MILNEGQPEAWRVHTIADASPTLYAERPPAILMPKGIQTGRRMKTEVKFYENHATDSRVEEIEVAMCMGASRNANASNNNPLVCIRRRKIETE